MTGGGKSGEAAQGRVENGIADPVHATCPRTPAGEGLEDCGKVEPAEAAVISRSPKAARVPRQ